MISRRSLLQAAAALPMAGLVPKRAPLIPWVSPHRYPVSHAYGDEVFTFIHGPFAPFVSAVLDFHHQAAGEDIRANAAFLTVGKERPWTAADLRDPQAVVARLKAEWELISKQLIMGNPEALRVLSEYLSQERRPWNRIQIYRHTADRGFYYEETES